MGGRRPAPSAHPLRLAGQCAYGPTVGHWTGGTNEQATNRGNHDDHVGGVRVPGAACGRRSAGLRTGGRSRGRRTGGPICRASGQATRRRRSSAPRRSASGRPSRTRRWRPWRPTRSTTPPWAATRCSGRAPFRRALAGARGAGRRRGRRAGPAAPVDRQLQPVLDERPAGSRTARRSSSIRRTDAARRGRRRPRSASSGSGRFGTRPCRTIPPSRTRSRASTPRSAAAAAARC